MNKKGAQRRQGSQIRTGNEDMIGKVTKGDRTSMNALENR